MGGRKIGKTDTTVPPDDASENWPGWARGLVSAVLIFHILAITAAALGASVPSSELEQAWHHLFMPYYDLIDQGYAYRYYAPEPPPTPVVEATLRFQGGRPDEVVRLPDRAARPRLRYQRQLALAFHLWVDFKDAQGSQGDGSVSRWARSYARHLCRTRPGCTGVTLRARVHRIPELPRVRESLAKPGAPPVDPDAEEFYETPERIGDYACDGL
jgi:hypothetical protein